LAPSWCRLHVSDRRFLIYRVTREIDLFVAALLLRPSGLEIKAAEAHALILRDLAPKMRKKADFVRPPGCRPSVAGGSATMVRDVPP
jgi:hypothetical protein